jgi:hypothetical protein
MLHNFSSKCHERACTSSFHVTCGREHNLCLQSKEGKNGMEFLAYCDKHTPASYKRREKKLRFPKWTPSKRPATTLRNQESKLRKSVISLSKAKRIIPLPSQIIEGVFEYWLTKRQNHCGLPLLKSLAAQLQQTPSSIKKRKDVDKRRKSDASYFQDLVLLRTDFERVEFLIELVKRREKVKRDLVQTMRDSFELQINPIRFTVERLISILDK